jgi:two-component system sensor histidine kinase PilS (NtrC family)
MSEDAGGLKKKIKALIIFRVIFVTLFFGASFFFRGFERFSLAHSIYYLIASLYVITVIYSLLVVRIRNLVAFAYIQLLIDVISEIILVYMTGGAQSLFSFTFVITIIASSIVLNKKAGFVIATVSSLFYGILINLQLYNFLPVTGENPLSVKDYLYKIFVYTIFFYLTAYLSGYLSSRLEKTVQKLEEKDLNLRDLEFFNKEVIENMPGGLFTTDLSGKVLLFNRAAERITGTKREEIIGRKIDSVLSSFAFPFSEGRSEKTITIEHARKIIGLTISQMKGAAENTKGFIVVFQDLTKFKRLEREIKQKEKWAAIGELSSNIAHEIRNPLASLRGSIEMLKEDSVPRNYKEKLMEIALNEMDRLNRIITDFLTYSRPSPPEFKKFDVNNLLDETVELLKNACQNNTHVTLKKDHDAAEVDADPQKMRQVFWNLGMNAIEAMSDGGEIIISTKEKEGFIEIAFQDFGTGIAEKDIEKIFYPFFTTKEQGTGLGLAIAYRIVEEHNGTINVKSISGIGTTFEIILPRTNEKA